MASAASTSEQIMAGETASIENVQAAPLSISLESENGCKITLDLAPKQILGFSAGESNAQLTLVRGDPGGLRIIKPETV